MLTEFFTPLMAKLALTFTAIIVKLGMMLLLNLGSEIRTDTSGRSHKMKSFGEAFREARKKQRITLRKIANIVGKSIGYLSDIEHDRKGPPPLPVVEKIENILGMRDHFLLNLAADIRRQRPADFTKRIQMRPMLSELLLRADEFSDDELEEILEELKEKENSAK